MRINSTAVFTVTLLLLMIGSGVATGFVSYAMGDAALKTVTQPDTRPTNKLAKSQEGSSENVAIVREEEIIAKVRAHRQKQAKAASKTQKK